MVEVIEVPGEEDARAEALRRIPAAHSLALRLRAAGLDDELIGECLSIEVAAVGPLLVVAEAKLRVQLASHGLDSLCEDRGGLYP